MNENEFPKYARWVARIAAALGFLTGALGLLGWVFDSAALKSVAPGFLPMVPNAALGFALSGVSLWLLCEEPIGGVRNRLAQAAGLIVALLGASALAEYLFHWQLGIDHFLFREKVLALNNPVAGRPAFLAALNFLFLGSAVVLRDVKRLRAWFVELLIAVPLEISLLALIGYLFGVRSFYSWNTLFSNTSMALNSTVAFAVLGFGFLCARTDRGLMKVVIGTTAGSVVARRLLLAPVIIPIVTSFLGTAGRRAGFYNAEFANWLFSFLNIFVFTLVIWWIATLLHRAELVRAEAEREVRQLNEHLEKRVIERTAELKQAEESIREREERLQLIIDAALDAVITIDQAGMVTGWSKQAEVMFGWSSFEMLGHRLSETIIPPRYRAAHEQGLKHFTATGEGPVLNRRIELVAQRRDGAEFPIELAVAPVRVGREYMFSAFVRDITEQKRARTELEKRRSELELIFNTVPALIFFKDCDHRHGRINQAMAHFLGVPKETIEGRTDAEIGTPNFERYYRDDNEVFSSGEAKRGIIEPVETANGTRWLQTDKFPIREDGTIVGLIGFALDITERKLAEEKLQAQLARLALLNHITRAIGERQDLHSILQVVIRNLEENLPIDFGCVCLREEAQESLVVASAGAKDAELREKLKLNEGARIAIEPNALTRCLAGELVYEPDVSKVPFPFCRRLTGEGLHSLIAAPLLVESQVFGVLIALRRDTDAFNSPDCEFVRQLSEHVALAAHQAQIHSALQQAYTELRQTQQSILQQERLRALGQMASGIAHDINNAISPITLYTESLLEREADLSPRAREQLTTIQNAVEDVAQTVARMRQFYRQREPQLTLAPIDFNTLVQQVLDLTRVRWRDMPQERGIDVRLQTEFASELPMVMGADGEIRDALTNLIINAVDAMPEGGVLTLRTRAVIDSGVERVFVEVSDTGVGMDENTRRHCLEPFFTTKGERGTGLGLAMVYGMVERHSAEIEIESTPNTGTTMRLIFPVATTVETSSGGEAISVRPTQRLRILIVDDDPLLIKSLQDSLEDDGHIVTAASGGQAGIDAFMAAHVTEKPFAAVITDLGMPQVDGRKVASAIKKASPLTPVIMLTGWGQRLMAEGDIPVHIDRLLSKPPRLRLLREVLAELTEPKSPA